MIVGTDCFRMVRKKLYTVAFHVVCWLLVALPTVVFVPLHMRHSTLMYFMRLCLPLSLCILFYINYLWLVPRYFVKRRINVYICINLLLIILFAFGLDVLMDQMHSMEESSGWIAHRPPRPAPEPMALFFGFMRKMFPFLLSVVLAASLRLSMRWHKAETERREMEMKKTEAELSNLRNQINPHFLLNTLNNIYALISFDTDKAQRAVLSLSALLRKMLYGGKDNSASLKDEVDFIRNYVELMKLRLSKNVNIDLSVDVPGSDHIRVAPFIFISLVENAFKHGISATNHSFVFISLKYDAGKIICDIRNSNYPKDDTDKSGHGIGLEQVAKRLELAYPGKYEWQKGLDEHENIYYSKITIYEVGLCDNR